MVAAFLVNCETFCLFLMNNDVSYIQNNNKDKHQ